MSRYVFFYKLNSKEGKEHLRDDLTSEKKFEKSFADFISDRASECGSSFKVSYDQIIKSILKDFNEIHPDELREIVNWYEHLVDRNIFGVNTNYKKNEQLLAEVLKNSGIEPLFEITSSSTSCYAFIFQYGNFTDRYELDAFDDDDDGGSNIKAYDFIRFIEYVILLTCKINEADLNGDGAFKYSDEYSNNAQHVIDRIKLAHKDDIKLNKLIEDEFEWIKTHWLEHIEDQKNNDNARITPEAHTVYDTYHFLRSCLEMVESIKDENKNIVMIHS
jgi:hypothetical protein